MNEQRGATPTAAGRRESVAQRHGYHQCRHPGI